MIKRCNFKTNCVCSYIVWTGDNENEIINFCGDKATVTHQYAIGHPSLYLVTDIGKGMLPNPPMEIDWDDCATIGEVSDLIDGLSDSADESALRIQQLLDTGKTTMIKEY